MKKIFKSNIKYLILFCLPSIIVFGYRNCGFLFKDFFAMRKRKQHFDNIARGFYKKYKKASFLVEQRLKQGLSRSMEYDFSGLLILLEEFGNLMQFECWLDFAEKNERDHFKWLKGALEKERGYYLKYLARVKHDRKMDHKNVRSRRSLLYYLRALNNSLAKINLILAKVRVKR